MRTSSATLVSIFLLPLCFFGPVLAEEPDPEQPAPDFGAFQELLSGARLDGHFTMTGGGAGAGAGEPKAESYLIKNVQTVGEDGRSWIFLVSFDYGGKTWDLPLPIQVEWAARTPVITLDNFTIPGMGTFNARVLFADGLYAGTWAHGKKAGGHLYGTVSHPEETVTPPGP